jgi:hypothetical protein
VKRVSNYTILHEVLYEFSEVVDSISLLRSYHKSDNRPQHPITQPACTTGLPISLLAFSISVTHKKTPTETVSSTLRNPFVNWQTSKSSHCQVKIMHVKSKTKLLWIFAHVVLHTKNWLITVYRVLCKLWNIICLITWDACLSDIPTRVVTKSGDGKVLVGCVCACTWSQNSNNVLNQCQWIAKNANRGVWMGQ